MHTYWGNYMFTIYNSNQMDILKELVLSVTKMTPKENIFQEDVILVQTPGMAQWVKQSLANEFGICANSSFPMPSSFIWRALHEIVPDTPKESAFTKDGIKWALVRILPEVIELDLYEPLMNYMTSGDVTPTKLHQLAGKVADVYDKYLVYRPDWILDWEKDNIDPELVAEHPWQPDLWNRIYDFIVSEQDNPPHHRANMLETLLDTLESYKVTGAQISRNIPSRICVLGVSSIAPIMLDVFKALGDHIDIIYMNLNPTPYYWGDIKNSSHVNKLLIKQFQKQISLDSDNSETDEIDATLADSIGNSLLSSMGTVGRDQNALFAEREIPQEEVYVDASRDTLLKSIQCDIYNLEDQGDPEHFVDSSIKQAIQHSDRSVQLHKSHSAIREIESLHNFILQSLEDDKELTPKDIIVMVPDINEYAPYIEATFGNIPRWDKKHIPYSISDKTANNEYPIVATFLELLKLSDSRFSATEVMEILKNTAVLSRFELEQTDYDELYSIVKDVAIRWGIDDSEALDGSDIKLNVNSWRTGLTRMLLGYSMDSDHGFYGDTFPYDLPMGVNAELIGKLADFVGVLEKWSLKLKGLHSGDDWFEMLSEMNEDVFIAKDNHELFALNLVNNHIKKLYSTLKSTDFNEKLSLGVIRLELEEGLTKEQTSQQFLAGKLNFCTLMPMRSIPFKLVCVIGLNDGVFPRSQTAENYDLTAFFPRIGDKSRRNEDRYMFLEALVSAQDTFYLSYISKSDKDGSEKISSILIQELMDYIHTGYCLEGDESLPSDESGDILVDHLSIQHAMNPYSIQEFTENGGSFMGAWADAINAIDSDAELSFGSSVLSATEESIERLNLTELLKFWKLPVKHFFNRRLKADLSIQSNALSDFEPFEFGILENFKLRMDMFNNIVSSANDEHISADECISDALKYARGRGIAPVGHFATLQLEKEFSGVERVCEEAIKYCVGEEITYDISIPLSLPDVGVNTVLAGIIKGGYEDVVCEHKTSKVNSKDLLEAFIKQLALSLMSKNLDVYVIGLDKTFLIKPIDKDLCESLLKMYATAYFVGLSSPIPYIPDMADIAVKASRDRKLDWLDIDDAKEAAFPKLVTHFERKYADGGTFPEPHVRRLWEECNEEAAEQMFHAAHKFLKPIYSYIEEVK
ncbi:RecBCD enzyme subunit RecC [Vibrio chagasii]|nr:RecBCD enzyme subunit RecC [Vibrio chagasii]